MLQYLELLQRMMNIVQNAKTYDLIEVIPRNRVIKNKMIYL